MSSADRTPDQIAAEIAETRNRLATTIDQLAYRAKPKTIVARKVETTKASFYNSDGTLNRDKVTKVAGVIAAVVVAVVALRKVAG